jgi:hypothetical protein
LWKEMQEKKSLDSIRLEDMRIQRMNQRVQKYQPADILALSTLSQIKSN